MTEFTEKQPGDKTFQLSGIFCFYSPRRGEEYNTTAYYNGDFRPVIVNYYSTLLSDGTPGGLAGDEFVRPDEPGSYVLIGKVLPNPGGPTVLEEVNLEKEVAMQLGLPYEDPRNPPPVEEKRVPPREEYNKRAKAPRTSEQKEREKNQRRSFDNKSNTKIKHYMNKYTTKIR